MAVKIYKPTSPGRRKSSVEDFSDITKVEPEKSLVVAHKPKSGRNNTGRITVRHQGGGVKRMYRLVDFKQEKFDVQGEVIAVEYDPSRGPRVLLVEYSDKTKAYVLGFEGAKVGTKIMSSAKAIEAAPGAPMPL